MIDILSLIVMYFIFYFDVNIRIRTTIFILFFYSSE